METEAQRLSDFLRATQLSQLEIPDLFTLESEMDKEDREAGVPEIPSWA